MTRLKHAETEAALAGFQAVFKKNNKVKPLQLKFSPFAYVEPFEGFFVRSYSSWKKKTKSEDPNKILLECVRHVLKKYTVAHCFDSAWNLEVKHNHLYNYERRGYEIKQDTAIATEHRLWYVCVTQGGSLYKEYLHPWLTKKEVHCLVNCNLDCNLTEAVWFAIAQAESGNLRNATLVSRSKMRKFSFKTEFWRYVARFFSKHSVDNVQHLDDLIDYIEHRKNESQSFDLKGKTVKSLTEKMEAWHRDLARLGKIGGGTWEGLQVSDGDFVRGTDENKVVWHVRQILSGNKLAEEGNRMRHCVASRKHSCMSGNQSIWSMSYSTTFNKPKRAITFAVDNKDMTVIEARGLANRHIKPEEYSVLRTWASARGISIYSYL